MSPRPRYQRQAIEQTLAILSSSSALHEIVRGPTVQQRLAQYEDADDFALEAQARYRSWARRGLQATTFGVLVGAMLLLPLDDFTIGMPRVVIGTFQTLALVVTFGAMVFVTWLRPLDQWMSHRADAERLRAEIFADVIANSAPPGVQTHGLASDKLTLLVSAYIRDQLGFFERRSVELQRAASKVSPLRITAYALIGIGAVLGMVAFVNLTGLPLPNWLGRILGSLALTEANRWQLGFTTVASALLSYAAARTLMDEDERKAELYKVTASKIRRLLGKELPLVEAAATAGDERAIQKLFLSARNILQQEHAVWSFIRERDDESPSTETA